MSGTQGKAATGADSEKKNITVHQPVMIETMPGLQLASAQVSN